MITDKLIRAIIRTDNPTVAGLDPRLDYIPGFIKNRAFEEHGHTLMAVAAAFFEYNKMLIDELYDIVPAVKPQIAMYEQYGAEGIQAYIETVGYARAKGLIVIGDIKRGDIATTAEAYSAGHIGVSAVGDNKYKVFNEDFITLNPYLGSDSVEPFFKDCMLHERGLFMLVKTSNKRGGELQDLLCEGRPLYEHVAGLVNGWGENMIGSYGYSAIGAVVGATHPEQAKRIRELMPHGFFLVPGYGAQGGTAEELAVCFDKKGYGAIVNSSRGIIAAYKTEKYAKDFPEEEFAKAARQAALDMKEDLGKYIKISKGPAIDGKAIL